MQPERRKVGRPSKPAEEKLTVISARVPPAVAAQLRERVPARKRTEFIRQAIERALAELPVRREGSAEEVRTQEPPYFRQEGSEEPVSPG